MSVFALANTDPAIVTKLNATIQTAPHEPAVANRLSKIGFNIVLNSPVEAAAMFKSKVKKWGDMVKAVDLKIE
jgi:tripartite-type tricarboxylate transporter receptor subunit TctC